MFRVLRLRAAVPVLAAVLAASALSPALAQEKLTGDQIKKIVTGKSGTWVTSDKRYSGSTAWRADGSLAGKVDTGGSMQDFEGAWAVRGDRFCEEISIDPEGTRCHAMVKASGSSYQLIDQAGKVASTLTVR